MRTVDLGRAAAQAEIFRLKRLLRRQAMRAVWGAVAVVFLVAVLVMLHFVAYIALVPALLTPIWGAVAVLGFDVVIVLICGLMAMSSSPDVVEEEAKILRDQSLAAMRQTLALTAMLAPLSQMLFRKAGRQSLLGMTVAALLAKFVTNK
ncbi:hypothetical protein [Acidisphaera sp. L21]|uniref:hypothetical protein n=1 Tax=Acidisphaera sp. L21 TaxID=1641851 RepID=UPI00131D5DA5|nr:hypothetical protein [Acidisphaera sp. L21]